MTPQKIQSWKTKDNEWGIQRFVLKETKTHKVNVIGKCGFNSGFKKITIIRFRKPGAVVPGAVTHACSPKYSEGGG